MRFTSCPERCLLATWKGWDHPGAETSLVWDQDHSHGSGRSRPQNCQFLRSWLGPWAEPHTPPLTHTHTLNRSSCTTMSPRTGLLNAEPHFLEEKRGADNQVAGWGWLADSDPDKKSLMANASHKSAHFQCPEGWIIFLSFPFPRGQRHHPPLYRSFLR